MFSNKKLETLFAKAEKYIPQIKKYFKFENRLQEIEAFEKKLAIKFPDSFKEFYSVINGEIKYSGLFIFSLLPFENILRAWKDYFEGGTGEENTDFATIEDDVVKPFFEHPKRIPFLSDGSGNFVGFDFIPESKGQLGQIINLDLGEISGYFLRLFNSFDDYIDFITRSLDNGKIYPIFDDEESYFESSYRIWDDFIHHNSNENVLDKIS
ncbi:MAG TPA: SMI1/KNR4 family protein, partial [Emticicia sp.]